MSGISCSVVKPDNHARCSGGARYLSDYNFDNLLYARTVRSGKSRARLSGIEFPRLPANAYIVRGTDFPGSNVVPLRHQDMVYFAVDQVNYIGEPICLVAAESRALVEEICAGISISYDELPAVHTAAEALAEDAPRIFGKDNCLLDRRYETGDVDAALTGAACIYSDSYRSGYQEHVYMETNQVTAVYAGQRMTLYCSCQSVDAVKRLLSLAFGWPEDRFRVVCTTTGGGFGGKIETPVFLAVQAALAAWKSGRPVRLAYDRSEDILVTTKRHPARITITTGCDENNRLVAADIDIVLTGGAYASFSQVIADCAMKMATGAYAVPNVRVRGRVVATNNLCPGAFRGFGALQTTFAMEMHMANLARRLGLEESVFKQRNLLRRGCRTCTGGRPYGTLKLDKIVRRVKEMSDYDSKNARFAVFQGERRPGIGIAVYAFGAPHTHGSHRLPRKLALVKDANGRVTIRSTLIDIGQGLQTTLRKIAAEVLSIPYSDIAFADPDTDRDPCTGGTGASLSITLFGKSLERAARRMREQWREGETLEIVEDFIEPQALEWDEKNMQGDAFHTYSCGATVVEVEVDALSCEVEVTGVWTVNDVGRAIDETIVRGQIEGGIVQGLGFGIMERLENRAGRLQQTSLTDYIIPTSRDVPVIESLLLENPYPEGPFGAKSVGEMPIVGAGPAVISAIRKACGITLNCLPATPELIQQAMLEQGMRP